MSLSNLVAKSLGLRPEPKTKGKGKGNKRKRGKTRKGKGKSMGTRTGQGTFFGMNAYQGKQGTKHHQNGHEVYATDVGIIAIQNPDGSIYDTKLVFSSQKPLFDKLAIDCEVKLPEGADILPTVLVPISRVAFKESHIIFQACTYDATRSYIASWFGKVLHEDDKDWVARHPMAKDGGIPTEYTATVIHQLVAPYGLGVAAIRYPTGSLVASADTMGWIKALGCNFMAMADHTTTNEEAAKLLGITLEEANAQFRVEFSESVAVPCIVGEAGWSNSSSVTTGAQGGHSRYISPRGHVGNWRVCVQLDLLKNINYIMAPPDPEYIPRKGAVSWTVTDLRDKDGKKITVYTNSYADKSTPVSPVTPSYTGVGAYTGSGKQVEIEGAGDYVGVFYPLTRDWELPCTVCSQPVNEDSAPEPGLLICDICYEAGWMAFKCPECDEQLTPETVSLYDGTPTTLGFVCENEHPTGVGPCNTNLGTEKEWNDILEKAAVAWVAIDEQYGVTGDDPYADYDDGIQADGFAGKES